MIRRQIFLLILFLTVGQSLSAALTLEECVAKARNNYPAIRNLDLLRQSCDIQLSDINRGWLPRASVYGQVTAQNVVPSFPRALAGVMEQMGQDLPGLGRVQYKVGVDLSQTLWDGGASSVRRQTVKARTMTEQAATEVEIYAVRQRVENLYFAILLAEEQILRSRVTENLLKENLDRLRSMYRNGVAMAADVDMVEAEMLVVGQSIVEAESAVCGYRQMLGVFVGEDITGAQLALPEETMPALDDSSRPELRLLDLQSSLNRLIDRMTDTSLMPKFGFFAQSYYGYPGFDYFRSMSSRALTFNILAGVKVTWTLDGFYTKKNSRGLTRIRDLEIATDREKFLFNNRLQVSEQVSVIEGLRRVIADDNKIVELRGNVRRAACSQLENGIIDPAMLLSKISDENMARLTAGFHKIRLLQEIYKLKYILNR